MKFNKYWFISGTLAFVIIFSFLIVDIYTRTIEDEKKDYQLQQLEMAKNAALGVSYLLDQLSNNIKFLASLPQIKELNNNSVPYIKRFLYAYESKIVNSIFLAGKNGRILYSTGKEIPEWVEKYTENSILGKGMTQDNYISNVIRDEDNDNNPQIYFQLVVAIVNDNQKESIDTIGYLGYLIDFNLLVGLYIKPLKLSKNDFAWIIDSEGILIYHPQHSEMLFRSIKNTSEECFDCHTSFDPQKSMISSSKPSVGEYFVIRDEPAKVMAYYPVQLQDERWILVISASVNKVTENLRSKFQVFFILGFIILGVILLFGLLIYFINLRRIKAEEAKRNLEQAQLYQEQLNQVSKMASIGELVDSVAHEINTPAGIISAHVDGIILGERYNENINNVLKIIKRQTERISNYTKSLLNYSQRLSFNPEMTNLRNLMQECLYMLGYRFRAKQIDTNVNYDQFLPNIYADQHQIEQVFINILNNAIDAISEKGVIKISINNSKPINGSEGVFVSIEDNGSGILKEHLDKIFDPFFSTKLSSNGTGLGLSITKAIVSRHKGTISAQSSGNGTMFRIFFPLKWE